MLSDAHSDFRGPDPWRPLAESETAREIIAPQPYVDDPRTFTFEAELQREVCPEHPLYQIECRAIARNCDHSDEFIFLTDDPKLPLAFVHLTWQVESSPLFPYTVRYSSWDEFRDAWKEEQ